MHEVCFEEDQTKWPSSCKKRRCQRLFMVSLHACRINDHKRTELTDSLPYKSSRKVVTGLTIKNISYWGFINQLICVQYKSSKFYFDQCLERLKHSSPGPVSVYISRNDDPLYTFNIPSFLVQCRSSIQQDVFPAFWFIENVLFLSMLYIFSRLFRGTFSFCFISLT